MCSPSSRPFSLESELASSFVPTSPTWPGPGLHTSPNSGLGLEGAQCTRIPMTLLPHSLLLTGQHPIWPPGNRGGSALGQRSI